MVKQLVKVDPDYDAWLEQRKAGLGSSDAAAILGLNRYKSPVSVYMDKVGLASPHVDTNFTHWGKTLEPIVADEFAKLTGMKVYVSDYILQHSNYPFMVANLDRLIDGPEGHGLLECKTTSEYNRAKWDGDEVPEEYYVQVQHQLAVSDLDLAYIAVLIGGNSFKYKRVLRDEAFIEWMIGREADFWNNHVVPRIPPAPDGSEDYTNYLSTQFPTAVSKSTMSLPEDFIDLLKTLDEVGEAAKLLESRKNEIINTIKEKMGTAERGFVGDRSVGWTNVTTNRFDTTSFKTAYPDLYKQFTKASPSRRFTVS